MSLFAKNDSRGKANVTILLLKLSINVSFSFEATRKKSVSVKQLLYRTKTDSLLHYCNDFTLRPVIFPFF
eukprot:UN09823